MHTPMANNMHSTYVNRLASNIKRRDLKEKVVQIYESFFKKDGQSDLFINLANNDSFWNDFFLLRANPSSLLEIIDSLDKQDLLRCKNMINLLFTKSVSTLDSDSPIRIANASITLLIISQRILISSENLSTSLDLLIGGHDFEVKIALLSNKLYALLVSENSPCFRSILLKIYCTFLMCCHDTDTNPFVDHLVSLELFDLLLSFLASPVTRQYFGFQVIVLLTILINHKGKKNLGELFAGRLSSVDNEVALDGYAKVISHSFLEFTRKFDEYRDETSSTGLLSSIASMVGHMFIAEEIPQDNDNLEPDDTVLVAFYEIVHLNRHFIAQLTHTHGENYLNGDPSLTLNSKSTNKNEQIQNLPSNLLVTFFEFCSIVMLQTKSEENFDTIRLAFIILTCITEDQCANAIMHDLNVVFRVQLHRMPMRHRKVNDESFKGPRPLAYSILDLMVEFLSTHLTKNLLCELYIFAIGVIHRLLCFQKRSKIRFNYSWRELWYALINLIKFLVNNESELIKKWNILSLSNCVVDIFNLFITFGDTFLPSPQSYDDLYYEIIRMHIIFDNLYSLALRYSSMENNQYREYGNKLSNSLINIKAIINHFNSKIEQWSVANQVASLTEEQVLEVVRNNYDSLTLKLQDSLDHFESYSHVKKKDIELFARVMKKVIIKYREKKLKFTAEDQQTLMQEILSNS
ncbi:armadillo-like helical domain-containing protein 3 [Brevipalpus obovatus]|uniref:armadillo-like helical domain-containing protein 3 n=1 Tax=Brevipalpus obovatus TaxID=246614 RepID=UPI003D9FA308